MNREIILSMHFHTANTNCFSTKDYTFYIPVDSMKIVRQFVTLYAKEFKSAQYRTYLSNDDVFMVSYNYAHANIEASKEWAKEMVELYYPRSFFNFDRITSYAEMLITKAFKRERKQYYEKKQKEGYVNHVDLPVPLSILKGNLPNQVILDNLDYLSTGYVGGYFGASSRMYKHDDWVTELYNSSDDDIKKFISFFLNHSNARYCMEHIDAETSKEDFLNRFKKYLEDSK